MTFSQALLQTRPGLESKLRVLNVVHVILMNFHLDAGVQENMEDVLTKTWNARFRNVRSRSEYSKGKGNQGVRTIMAKRTEELAARMVNNPLPELVAPGAVAEAEEEMGNGD